MEYHERGGQADMSMVILAEVGGKSAPCTRDRQQALTLIKLFLKPKRGLFTTYQSRELR